MALALPFINSNGDGTSTNNWGRYFARPEDITATDLGEPKTDTTAVNGLSGTSIDVSRLQTSSASTGGAQRNFGQKTDVRNITLTGDLETAPLHRGVLTGVYGRAV